MGRKYSFGSSSAKNLYREAHKDAGRSSYNKKGPAQVEVIKKYSGAARLFEEAGDLNNARKALEEADRYLRNRTSSTQLIKKIDDKLYALNEKLHLKRRGLERNLGYGVLSIASFVVALFFISFNLTGYSIGGLTQNSSTLISSGLFVLGLVFAFFHFKNKK